MINYFEFSCLLGQLIIGEENGKICKIILPCQGKNRSEEIKERKLKEPEIILEAKKQLEEYFEGKRKKFDFPLSLEGTQFQRRVWEELKEIPYGQVISYKELAQKINSPKACRAVGNANNKNPIPIIVPCHRVIGSDGKLVGYAGGIDVKKRLLDIEKSNS